MPVVVALTALRAFVLLASLPYTTTRLVRMVKGGYAFWSGKRIAVIGPTGSGKDSFLARLQGRGIPAAHVRSPVRERIKSFRVTFALTRNKVVDIECKGVVNVGGDVEHREAKSGWLSVCKDADVIFYVMTVEDLMKRRFVRGRVRDDLDWLLTEFPHLMPNALVHILINKIDDEIATHTDYPAFRSEIARDLRALDKTLQAVLHPYQDRYTGATLISMKNKQIYTLAIHNAFRAVYSAFYRHEAALALDRQLLQANALDGFPT